MANFSIIGQGNMGQAIASVLTDGGAAVDFVSREATTINGDIVVLAVPFPAVDDIVSRLGSQLEGKTVVDITNPLNFETFDSLVVPSDGSAAQEITAKLLAAKRPALVPVYDSVVKDLFGLKDSGRSYWSRQLNSCNLGSSCA